MPPSTRSHLWSIVAARPNALHMMRGILGAKAGTKLHFPQTLREAATSRDRTGFPKKALTNSSNKPAPIFAFGHSIMFPYMDGESLIMSS